MGILDKMNLRRADPNKEMQQALVTWLRGEDCTLPYGYINFTDCPEVIMAVNVYARLISSMTIHLMENSKLGDVRLKNALSAMVDISPNPDMTSRAFYENLVRVLLLYGKGNQVTVPIIKDGYLQYMRPLEPSKVRFEEKGSRKLVIYDNDKSYNNSDILHFVLNPDPERPWIGTGYNIALRDAVRSIKQSNVTKKAILENPNPSIIVKVDALAEEFASMEGRDRLSRQYINTQGSGKPWIVPSEFLSIEQVKPLTINDLAIQDGLELDIKQIAAMFGVPSFLLGVGEYDRDEYNSFIRTQVMPIAREIEQELTRKLLISPDWYFRFNPNSLYAYDLTEKVQAGSVMTQQLAMSRNEWRDWVGFSPREDMEELIVLENYIPADMIGKQSKLQGGDDE